MQRVVAIEVTTLDRRGGFGGFTSTGSSVGGAGNGFGRVARQLEGGVAAPKLRRPNWVRVRVAAPELLTLRHRGALLLVSVVSSAKRLLHHRV